MNEFMAVNLTSVEGFQSVLKWSEIPLGVRNCFVSGCLVTVPVERTLNKLCPQYERLAVLLPAHFLTLEVYKS